MTAPPIFPVIPGLGYPLSKVPDFSTGVFIASSGIRTRVIRRIAVQWTFTMTFDGLASDGAFQGLGTDSFETLAGFFTDQIGAYGAFLLLDPTDSTLTNAPVGTGDGTTTEFAVTRILGSTYPEPVGWLNASDITSVSVGGSVVSSSTYSVTAPNLLTFTSAPAAAAAILITVSKFYFQCTLPDNVDFEQFLSNLWDVKEMKVRSLVPNYPTLLIGA